MHKQRVAILMTAALGMGGTFLPWVTLLGSSASGTAGSGGWITFWLFAAAAVTALAGDRRRSWRGGGFVAFAIPALLASAVGIHHIVYLFMKPPPVPGQINLLALARPGWGLYLVAAAGIVLVGAAFALQGPALRPTAEAVPTTA
jgi:hypothetical protein